MESIKFTSLLLAAFTMCASKVDAQVTVANDMTVEWYVENVLLGSGVSATNITFNGQPADQVNAQCGYFEGDVDYPGVTSGLVLSTGELTGTDFNGDPIVLGQQATLAVNGGTDGDADLQSLVAGAAINDIAVLEFDFIPTGDTLRFNYVFGSEEYPEFVDTQWNDVFGFFISGPGITGPYSSPAGFPNGSQNIALIPTTSVPVTIGNVNNGNAQCFDGPSGPCMNCQFYVDNCPIEDIALDGTTTVLQAFALVQCGETYHIKLAIADRSDWSWDSAVFLQEGSFASDLAVSATLFSSLNPVNDGFLYENCGYGIVEFTREGGLDAESQVELTVTGVGQNGIDFTPIPASFQFPAGEASYILELYAILDGITEGLEEVIVTITNTSQSACAQGSITTEFTFQVADNPDPLAIQAADHSIDCGDQVEISVIPSGGYGLYRYTWSNGITDSSQYVSPGVTTDYIISVVDTCNAGVEVDTVTVTVPVYPAVDVELADTTELTCLEVVTLAPDVVAGGDGTYQYDWTEDGESLGSAATQVYVGSSTNVLTLTVTDGCGSTGADNMLMLVPVIPIVIETSSDTLICNGQIAVLESSASGGEPPFDYAWTIATDPDPLQSAIHQQTTVVAPQKSTLYTISVTDLCQHTETENVRVSVSEVNALFGISPFGYYGVEVRNFSSGINTDTLSYLWDFGDGTTSTEEEPNHIFAEIKDLVITLYVESEMGCWDTTYAQMNAPPSFYIPNSFSPNNDGLNDQFKIVGEGIIDYELSIYNRLGQRIFHSLDIEEPWNGRGADESEYIGDNSAYVYHLQARLIDGQRVDKRGIIALIR